MASIPIVADDAAAKAEKIRQAAEQAYAAVRARKILNPSAARSAIARAYLTAKQQMTDLQQTSVTDAAANRRALANSVWGITDVAGSSGSTLTASISYR